MSNRILEIAAYIKKKIQSGDGVDEYNWQEIVEVCNELEQAIKINEESTKLIEAFCADDAEWHKLIDTREQENSLLISLVIKLADKCNQIQKEIEKPQTYSVGWNGKLIKSGTGEIVNLYDVMEILNKHGVKIKDE